MSSHKPTLWRLPFPKCPQEFAVRHAAWRGTCPSPAPENSPPSAQQVCDKKRATAVKSPRRVKRMSLGASGWRSTSARPPTLAGPSRRKALCGAAPEQLAAVGKGEGTGTPGAAAPPRAWPASAEAGEPWERGQKVLVCPPRNAAGVLEVTWMYVCPQEKGEGSPYFRVSRGRTPRPSGLASSSPGLWSLPPEPECPVAASRSWSTCRSVDRVCSLRYEPEAPK